MTVRIEIGWTLTRIAENEIIWQKFILTSGSTSSGEKFSGAESLRTATERAAMSNIEEGIRQISQLKLN